MTEWHDLIAQEGRGGANTATLRSQMLEVNSFRERLYDNPIGNVWMTEDGAPLPCRCPRPCPRPCPGGRHNPPSRSKSPTTPPHSSDVQLGRELHFTSTENLTCFDVRAISGGCRRVL